MEIQMLVDKHWLSRKDFGSELRDEIAFDIAFVASVGCKDKESVLEAIYATADEIIEKVRAKK